MKRTGLKTFYKQFLNYNLFRDYRNQTPINNKYMNCLRNDKYIMQYSSTLDYGEAILRWLIRKNIHPSKHYYELAYYSDIGALRLGEKKLKYNDRLMFDFDIEDQYLDDLKKTIKTINDNNTLSYRQKEREIKKVQKQIRDTILNTDTIIPAYKEAKTLSEYFKECNIPFFNSFSGNKGFHVYVFFPEIRSSEINNKFPFEEAIKLVGQDFQNKFNFKTLDQSPFKDILSRLDRLPYSTHESSLLKVLPCNLLNESLTDILKQAKRKKNNYNPFHIEESLDFYELLQRYTAISIKQLSNESKVENVKQVKKLVTGNIKGVVSDGYNDSIFKDMRVLCRFLIGDYFVSSHDKYDLYTCCFHEYDHPSVIVSEKAYNCKSFSCTAEVEKQYGTDKLNYWNFIKKYFNLKNDSDVKRKMREINNKYLEAKKQNE